MANGNFVVRNGLTVGPLTIDATTGSINTSGDVNITGNVGVSQIAKNDSSITITDTGSGSNITFKIDDGIEHTMTGALTSLRGNLSFSPDNTADAFVTSGTLTDVIGIGAKSANSFAQLGIANRSSGTSASSDFVAYADSGNNTRGFIDMGIASSGFNDATYGITRAGDGYIFLSAPTYANAASTGGNLVLATADGSRGDIVFAANGFVSGTEQGRFRTGDGLYLTGNLVTNNGTIYQGPVAKEFEANATLSDPSALFTGNINSFAQVALHNRNSGSSASADYIAYADRADNDNGFIDMGICSTSFTDPAFAVTSAGDGYIFVSAPAYANTTPTGGNLVLATADGAYGDIVFAAGGFATGEEQGRFINGDGLHVEGNLVSQNGTIFQGANAIDLLTSSNANTTLSTTVNTTATTFTVSSTAGFLDHGRLEIESEILYYTGKSAGAFTGITRGTSGSTAASHTGGAGVKVFQPVAGITGASTVLTGDEDGFVQVALRNRNAGTSASTDIIAYTSNGDNNSGWIDMGITSETFNDATYGITGPDTGYIFMSAPRGTAGTGSLFLSTSQNGSRNDIVFTTGGFTAGNERVRIVGTDRQDAAAGVIVNIATTATSTTSGALRITGGVGLQGNLFVGGNFNLTGNITIGGTGSTTSTSTLIIENPITFLANANNADAQDIGVVGQYSLGGTTNYFGVVRDSITKSVRVFDGLTTKPNITANFAGSTAGNLYAGSLMLANTTVSSSTTSGALIVAGGVGIGGKAYIGGDVQIAGTITPSANLTYNLGSVSSWWGTLYGVSTQAKYADLAENYQADKSYPAGTVVMFGGDAEVTQADVETRAVAGVVSTNPAHLMNGGLTGTNVVPVALQGRAPCMVVGPVRKGDMMVSAGFGYAKASENPLIGQVIGKALCDFPSATKAVIEIVVGRN
jgi:hypothetical protein